MEVRASRERWLWLGLVALFLLLSVPYARKAVHDRSAILRWRPQIQELESADIYQRYAYPNPPVMAILLRPVAALPPLVGSLAWFALKAALTLLALHWVFRLVETPEQPFPMWAKVLTLLLSIRPIAGDLSHGNVNLFILFLVIGSLYAYRHGRDLTAGAALALAIACKVTPLLFVPYSLWKRSWKMLAGCAAGLALFLVLLPGTYLGMGRNLTLLHSWYGSMVQPYADGEVTTDLLNQSLPGLVFRLFTHGQSFHDPGLGGRETLAVVDPRVLTWAVKGCMAVFAAVFLWACRTPTHAGRAGWRLAAEYALVILGMLLFSERTWKHHCVTLVLPFAVIAYRLATGGPRWYLIATLAAAQGLMGLTATTNGLPAWDTVATVAQVGGAYTWAFVVLAAALVVLLRQGARQPAAGAGQGPHFALAISPRAATFSKTR